MRKEKDLVDALEIVQGDLPSESEITLVSIMRNNHFLTQAFLNHHRSLGVKRFVVLDDWSDQSFLELLKTERDVTVLRTPFRFSEMLRWVDQEGVFRVRKAGTAYKDLLCRHIVKHPWSMVLDGDEFLTLTPGLKNLQQLFAESDAATIGVFGAQMVDMMPEQWPPASTGAVPTSFDDLVELYPFFKPSPAWRRVNEDVAWDSDCNAISDLFRSMNIYSGPRPFRPIKKILRPVFPRLRAFPRSDVAKVPVIGPNHRHLFRDDHSVPAPIKGPMVLALAHFTFTHFLPNKVEAYLSTKSGGRKFDARSRYEAYARLLEALRRNGAFHFQKLKLERFEGEESFYEAGIFERSWNTLGGNMDFLARDGAASEDSPPQHPSC